MSDAKHTPAPWLIADESFVYALNDSGYNRFWAHVTGGNLRRAESTSRAEVEANARLIAAAPDLLDALQGIIGYFDSGNNVPVSQATIKARSDEVKSARAAIAKATGGSA